MHGRSVGWLVVPGATKSVPMSCDLPRAVHRLAVVRSNHCPYEVPESANSPAESWSRVRPTACARLWSVMIPPTDPDWA